MTKHVPMAIATALVMAGCSTTINTGATPGASSSPGATSSTMPGGTSTGTGSTMTGTPNPGSAAPMTHDKDITASETWAKGVHLVDGDIHIGGDSAPVVTIEPGCIIKFTAGSSLVVKDNGGLMAKGTDMGANSILFTSSTTAQAGSWNGIFFQGANSSQCMMSNCVVEGAGGGDDWISGGTSIDVYATPNCSPSFSNMIVRTGRGKGFTFDNNRPAAFTGIRVTGMSDVPVQIGFQNADALTSGGTTGTDLTGNGTDAVVVMSENSISKNATWAALNVPYRLNDNGNSYEVKGENNPVWTLNGPMTLQMGKDVSIGVFNGGGMIAKGTAAGAVDFTVLPNSLNKGQWGGISFDGANASQCNFDYVTVEYAGGANSWGYAPSGIYTKVAFPITHTMVKNSAAAGISAEGVTLTLGADVTYDGDATNLNNVQ